MAERSRIRRILKRGGVAACGLILVLWVITFFWEFGYLGKSMFFNIGPGYFAIQFQNPFPDQGGWFLIPTESSLCWWPIPHLDRTMFLLPSSLLLVVIAVPIAILHRHDRPIPPGHCQHCGYNLTGNVSGKCPECGTGVGPVPPGKGEKG
jgi:hypothetical protein